MIAMKEAVNVISIVAVALIGLLSIPTEKAKASTATRNFAKDLAEYRGEKDELGKKVDNLKDLAPPKPAGPTIVINGQIEDARAFISKWFRRAWTYPGSIEAHLREHGVQQAAISALSHIEKERLHAAIHEKELVEKVTTQVVKPQVQSVQYQSCPGGVCPAPQVRQVQPRRGLFGRWK